MKHRVIFFVLKIIAFVLCILYWNEPYFWPLILCFAALWLIIPGIGSYKIQLNYFIKSVNQIAEKGVVLTFDDGPDPETTPQILQILEEYQVKATFFVIGDKAEQHAEIIKDIDQKGHTIGNHSYSHSNWIPFFRVKKLKADFDLCSEIVFSIIGKRMNWMRPPFGATSSKYTGFLKKTNLQAVGWSFRSMDTVAKSSSALAEKTAKAITEGKGQIMLFHDTKKVTVEALPKILQTLKQKGIKVLPLSGNIEKPPYETL